MNSNRQGLGLNAASQSAGAIAGGAPSTQPEVQRELDCLHNALSMLENTAVALGERLSPVLHVVPETKGDGSCSPSCGSTVGQGINSGMHRVNGISRTLNELIDRLAI